MTVLRPKRIKKTRNKYKLSMDVMSTKVGCSVRYYTYRETGAIEPEPMFSNSFRWVEQELEKKHRAAKKRKAAKKAKK